MFVAVLHRRLGRQVLPQFKKTRPPAALAQQDARRGPDRGHGHRLRPGPPGRGQFYGRLARRILWPDRRGPDDFLVPQKEVVIIFLMILDKKSLFRQGVYGNHGLCVKLNPTA